MPEDVQPTHDDEELVDALRAASRRFDPVPDEVVRASRESFTWRTIDAELAELAYDSVLDDARLAGVRSGDAPRTMTFEAPALTVELEVTATGDRRRLLGQLVPPGPADVEVRHAGAPVTVEADRLGRFAVDVSAGPVSLRCRLHGGSATVLETAWVKV